MRLRERDKTTLTLRQSDNAHNDNKTYQWAPGGVSIRAVHQPLSSTTAAQVYGQSVNRMRLLLYDGAEQLREGMGVCIAVPPDQSCDYRIISAEGWPVQRATLDWIEEARRA